MVQYWPIKQCVQLHSHTKTKMKSSTRRFVHHVIDLSTMSTRLQLHLLLLHPLPLLLLLIIIITITWWVWLWVHRTKTTTSLFPWMIFVRVPLSIMPWMWPPLSYPPMPILRRVSWTGTFTEINDICFTQSSRSRFEPMLRWIFALPSVYHVNWFMSFTSR